MERGIHKGAGIIKQSREGTVSQPIEVGAMFGGRYEVTEMVMASADDTDVPSAVSVALGGQLGASLVRLPGSHVGPLLGRQAAAAAGMAVEWLNGLRHDA